MELTRAVNSLSGFSRVLVAVRKFEFPSQSLVSPNNPINCRQTNQQASSLHILRTNVDLHHHHRGKFKLLVTACSVKCQIKLLVTGFAFIVERLTCIRLNHVCHGKRLRERPPPQHLVSGFRPYHQGTLNNKQTKAKPVS